MNKIILSGNFTKDLEIRTTTDGKEVASGSVAVSRSFKNKDGEYDSDFFNLVIWNPTDYVKGIKKGTKVLLDGEIRNETYENDKKEKKSITKIYVNHIEAFKKQDDKQENKQDKVDEPEVVNEFSAMNTKTEYEETPEVKLADSDLPF